MPALGDPENRWFTIYVHTCDADPRGTGERPTEGKQYVGQASHSLRDVERGFVDTAERAMWMRWRHKRREKSLLSLAVDQFGADSFTHRILNVVLGQEAANLAEDEWIIKLDSLAPRGYNRKRGGQAPLSAEERSMFCKLGWSKIPAEERRERARIRIEATPSEELSRRVYKRATTMGRERLAASISKEHKTRGEKGQKIATAKRIQSTNFTKLWQKAAETMGPNGLKQRAYSGWDSRWAKALASAEAAGDIETVEKIKARLDQAAKVKNITSEELNKLHESLATGTPMKDLAAQLGLPYMALYRLVRASRQR